MSEIEEFEKRCAAYAFFAGKQTGGILALLHAIELGYMNIHDIKDRLSKLANEFVQESETIFYPIINRS